MIKKFFYKAVLFALVFTLINAMLVYCYTEVFLSNSLLRNREKLFKANESPIDYLFLGDSHTATSINTRIIPNSFNYSSSGESYLQTYYKLKAIPEISNVEIKTVILPFDRHSFSSFRKYRMNDESYWVDKINLLNLGIENKESTFFKKWLKGNFFPYMGELRMIKAAIKNKRNNSQKNGIIDGVEIRKGKFADKNKIVEVNKTLDRHFGEAEVFDPDLINYLHLIFDYCEKKNKNLILVAYPVTKEYCNKISQYIAPETFQEELTKIKINFPQQVRFLDFTQVFDNQPDYFFDADHLNMEGAIKFSEILRDSLSTARRK